MPRLQDQYYNLKISQSKIRIEFQDLNFCTINEDRKFVYASQILKKFNIERWREIERLKFLSCLLHEKLHVYFTFNPFQRGNYISEYNSMNRLPNRAKSLFAIILYRKDYFVDGFSVYLIINSKCISRVQYETASVNFSIPIRVLNYAHAFYAGSLFIFLLWFILHEKHRYLKSISSTVFHFAK